MNFRLPGLVAAPHTPFHPNGEVAYEMIAPQCRVLVKNKVAGAFVCGTTGEGASLTGDERQRVVESWRAAIPSSVSRSLSTSATSSVKESRRLAQHAQDVGADAIAAIAPSFFKPSGAAGLADWCSRVASAAPKLPFYYYHMPAMTGGHDERRAVPGSGGPEDSHVGGSEVHPRGPDGLRPLRRPPERKVRSAVWPRRNPAGGPRPGRQRSGGQHLQFCGPALSSDHPGHSSRRNFKIAAARRDQLKAMEFIQVLHRYGGLASGKAVMKMIGVDCGPVRSPLRALTAAEEKNLRAELKGIGFFEYASKA